MAAEPAGRTEDVEPAVHIEAGRTEVVAVASAADRKAEEASAAESKTAAVGPAEGFWHTEGLRAFRPATFRRSGI